MGKQVGGAIGNFLACDMRTSSGEWPHFLRIRVEIDVRRPLKRTITLKLPTGVVVQLSLKNERLPQFCFFYGILRHTEHGCLAYFQTQDKLAPKFYSSDLRAPNRRTVSMPAESPWLR